MAALFDDFGIRFSYPENWTIERSDDAEEAQTVLVANASTAFWQLSKHPVDVSLESLFDEALGALRAEYHQIEVDLDHSSLEGQSLEGYLVHFFYLDLVTTCCMRAFKTEMETFFLVYQSEDREFTQLKPVFEAMLASLLRNLSQE